MQSDLRPDKSSPSGIRLRDDPLKFADDSDVDTESESRLINLTLTHCKKLKCFFFNGSMVLFGPFMFKSINYKEKTNRPLTASYGSDSTPIQLTSVGILIIKCPEYQAKEHVSLKYHRFTLIVISLAPQTRYIPGYLGAMQQLGK